MKKYLLSIALFLLVAGGVHASTITRYYSISAVGYTPRFSSQTYEKFGSELYPTNTSGGAGRAVFCVPVYLLDSAKVTEFKAWVYDSDNTWDVKVRIERTPHDNYLSSESMAIIASSGTSGEQEFTNNTIAHSVIDNATYNYWSYVELPSGSESNRLRSIRIKYETTTSGKEESKAVVPQRFDISQNRPNPSSGVTHIAYQLPKKSKVSLKVYDSSGRIVRTLVDGEQDAGHYTSTWYGKDNIAQMVPNGNYFYRLNIDGKAVTKKAIVLK